MLPVQMLPLSLRCDDLFDRSAGPAHDFGQLKHCSWDESVFSRPRTDRIIGLFLEPRHWRAYDQLGV